MEYVYVIDFIYEMVISDDEETIIETITQGCAFSMGNAKTFAMNNIDTWRKKYYHPKGYYEIKTVKNIDYSV